MGNAGILVRALAYGRMLGRWELVRVAEHATLNANYLAKRLSDVGPAAYPERRASHEFILTFGALEKYVDGNGFGQASFGLWRPCAHYLFPLASARVLPGRAHGNGN